MVFALGLPWVTGALFVMALWQTRQPGYRLLVTGMGLPLGLVCVIGGYRVLGHWGPGLHFGANVAIQVGLAAVLAVLAWRRWRRMAGEPGSYPTMDSWQDLSNSWRWLIGLVLAWLLVRWVGILVEVIHRPLFPWDAWYAYGIQAKVWFFHPQLDSFANGWRWFEAEGVAWASGGTRHPPGIGLMQLWQLQALGRFDDALMNLAWPAGMISFGLIIFGTLRLAGASLAVAVATMVLVVTLPVLNTQAVLAGYGDFWIALFLMMAVIGGVFARRWGIRWLLVSGVAVAGMLMLKETSWLWVPVLAVGFVAGWVRLRWLIVLASLAVIGFAAALWLHGDPIRISTLGRLGFSDGEFVFPRKINLDAWREIVMWPALLRHMFAYDNWHMFWYLAPFVAVGSIWYSRIDRGIAMAAMIIWTSLVVLVGFFSFSTLGTAVIEGTSVNRLMLHLVPSIGLLAGLVVTRAQSERNDPRRVGEGDNG